jgi:phosphoglycerate kinase
MDIKKIQNVSIENKKVLLRVDFNVAVENGKVKEKFKIEAAKETLEYLLDKKCKVALISHFGRPAFVKTLAGKPEGKIDPKFSFEPLADDINKILEIKTIFISDCIGEKVAEGLNNLGDNENLLLENVRFYKEEDENGEDFSRKLAEKFDIFVNDAFSVSHRDQASVTGVTNFLPSYAGFRLQKEIEEMEKIKNNFERPAVAIIGGAKIETKLPVIKFFEEKYDYVLVGGKIANEALDQKIKFSEKVILPVDFVDNPAKSDVISDHGASRLDIGPKTIEKFKNIISEAKMIVWNGPTGKYEEEKYAVSSKETLEAIIKSGAYSVVGGGETLEILEKYGAMDKINFVSTGGGAMLTYLGGEKMPGIEALCD